VEAQYVFKQILDGVKYMHDKGLCHRDLKMTNILINSRGEVKIIDFGFSVEAYHKLRMYCGTPSYMPPEMVNKKSYYGKPLDIWSLGVVLYKLLTGEYPFGGKKIFLFGNFYFEIFTLKFY
jgi:MAP/microtubule affinity-regulating kinase